MRIKHMFKKTVRDIRGEEYGNTPEVPDNLMRKCNACKAAVFVDEVKQNHYICPHCGNYFHVPAYRRIKMVADRKSLRSGMYIWKNRIRFSTKDTRKKSDDFVKRQGLTRLWLPVSVR